MKCVLNWHWLEHKRFRLIHDSENEIVDKFDDNYMDNHVDKLADKMFIN